MEIREKREREKERERGKTRMQMWNYLPAYHHTHISTKQDMAVTIVVAPIVSWLELFIRFVLLLVFISTLLALFNLVTCSSHLVYGCCLLRFWSPWYGGLAFFYSCSKGY